MNAIINISFELSGSINRSYRAYPNTRSYLFKYKNFYTYNISTGYGQVISVDRCENCTGEIQ